MPIRARSELAPFDPTVLVMASSKRPSLMGFRMRSALSTGFTLGFAFDVGPRHDRERSRGGSDKSQPCPVHHRDRAGNSCLARAFTKEHCAGCPAHEPLQALLNHGRICQRRGLRSRRPGTTWIRTRSAPGSHGQPRWPHGVPEDCRVPRWEKSPVSSGGLTPRTDSGQADHLLRASKYALLPRESTP